MPEALSSQATEKTGKCKLSNLRTCQQFGKKKGRSQKPCEFINKPQILSGFNQNTQRLLPIDTRLGWFQLILVACSQPGGWKSKCVQTDVGLDEDSEQRFPEGFRGEGVRQRKQTRSWACVLPASRLLMCYCDGNGGDGTSTQKGKVLQARAYD